MDVHKDTPIASTGDWALVLEGGGMRTSYECTVMGALAISGIHPHHFRWIFGVSAGAASAAYYISGQTGLGHEVWKRYLTGRRFIGSLRNIAFGRPIFDLNYLQHVYSTLDPINVQKIAAHSTEFLITLTNCATAKTRYVRPTATNCIPLLVIASAYPPFHRPKLFEGEFCADGALSDPIPIIEAIRRGAKNILVVSTTPRTYRAHKNWTMEILSWVGFPRHPRMRLLYKWHHEIYNIAKELIERPPVSVRIIAIQPELVLPAWELDTDPTHLSAAMKQGELDAERVIRQYNLAELIRGSRSELPRS